RLDDPVIRGQRGFRLAREPRPRVAPRLARLASRRTRQHTGGEPMTSHGRTSTGPSATGRRKLAGTPVLAVEGISKTDGGVDRAVRPIDQVDFEARDAEFCCLSGPSGRGKSTLMKILPGLVRPTEGRAKLNQ